MKIWENGIVRDMTPEEIAVMNAEKAQQEQAYWQSIGYGDAVDAQIRKRYSISQEFAILRQRDVKPEEYSAYFSYCEECKAFVKGKIGT